MPFYHLIKQKREATEAPAVGGGGRRTNQASRPLPRTVAPGDRQLMPQLQQHRRGHRGRLRVLGCVAYLPLLRFIKWQNYIIECARSPSIQCKDHF